MAVLDSGIDTDHPDLKDNIWVNEDEVNGNGRDDDKTGYVDDFKGVDLIDGKRVRRWTKNGHGTHVAGIIDTRVATTTGASAACAGRPRSSRCASWMPTGRGTAATHAAGSSTPWTSARTSSTPATRRPRRARPNATRSDTPPTTTPLIVAAAGNDHKNIDKSPIYPAAYPDDNVLTVAATNEKDQLASFSNYGKVNVDLAAPGDAIPSTWEHSDYRESSGTSMAAPLVTAAAAMLRKEGVDSYQQIRKLLLKNADDKSKLKDKVASGGRLNIRRALAAAD